ncbi:MAG: hypothetical protein IIV43_03825, partial [Oscillospiraceae bacterium]|nr:hypothetical protein [Oscillospiraceae bacterium]
DKVNTKTKYLVVGRTDNLPDWALERKLGLAEKLIADGKKIALITEVEYLELIRQAKEALNKTN